MHNVSYVTRQTTVGSLEMAHEQRDAVDPESWAVADDTANVLTTHVYEVIGDKIDFAVCQIPYRNANGGR